MDIEIHTCDPNVVQDNVDAIRSRIESLGLYVASITVTPREFLPDTD